MGSTIFNSKSSVYTNSSEQEQFFQYIFSGFETCTLRAMVGANTSSVSVTLRDYTFDREGTGVEIKVRGSTTNKSGIGPIDVRHWGKALDVISDEQSRYYIMTYGVPCDRMGALGMLITDPQSMFVIHLYGTRERVSVFVVKVWYDVGKGRFMSDLKGPSMYSSTLEACLGLEKAFDVKVANSTSQQTTTITGLINNTGGHVVGDFNGSIIKIIVNVFKNCK